MSTKQTPRQIPQAQRKIAAAKITAKIRACVSVLRMAILETESLRMAINRFPVAVRPAIWLTPSTYDESIGLGLSMRELESFKDKRLVKVLEALGKYEWDKTETRDYPGDENFGPNRDYMFTETIYLGSSLFEKHRSAEIRKAHKFLLAAAPHEIPNKFTITASVYAYVRSGSALCRSVVVGVEEKVERIEKRAIVCD